jgi:predicted Zn-dependent protease
MRMSRLMVAAALAGGGCTIDRPDTTPKPTSPYQTVRMPVNAQQLAQANVAACTRVYSVGQQITAKNPELPQRLVFRAAASPDAEIFHQGTSSIVITQKVIDMCANDNQLAAVLCMELGKMMAEHEAMAPLQTNPPPPLEGPAFNSTVGSANEDPMRLNELAQYEAHQRKLNSPPRLLDPRDLARKYLARAGYSPDELDRVKPILRAAAEHSDLEMQSHAPPRIAPFTPPG